MRRVGPRRLAALLVPVLALGVLWTFLRGGALSWGWAQWVFSQSRPAFETVALQAVEQGSGQGISRPFGVRDVTLWDYEGTAVDFAMGAFGLGSSTRYWGVQYVPSGERLGYQGVRLEGWTQEGDGWSWSEPGGDNICYLRELDGNWFYYEMEF